MRGPDKAPRRRRTRTEIEAQTDEFMPTGATMTETVSDEPKPDEQTVAQFAASVLNDPDYRKSIRERAKTGRLLPVEARMLMDLGKTEPEKKTGKGKLAEAIEFMTTDEIQTMGRIMAWVIGRRDGKQRDDDPAYRYVTQTALGEEIVQWRER